MSSSTKNIRLLMRRALNLMNVALYSTETLHKQAQRLFKYYLDLLIVFLVVLFSPQQVFLCWVVIPLGFTESNFEKLILNNTSVDATKLSGKSVAFSLLNLLLFILFYSAKLKYS